ncbi:MAG: hypothetical protein HC852_15855 [Acaryochloridaceae cyanobacterium RU_4_10]|nr:hypothetical protein [Acaryochloridaceae cyanobacterium RU_4_10]
MKKVLWVGSVFLLAAGWGFITQAQQTPAPKKNSSPTAKPTQQRPIVDPPKTLQSSSKANPATSDCGIAFHRSRTPPTSTIQTRPQQQTNGLHDYENGYGFIHWREGRAQK